MTAEQLDRDEQKRNAEERLESALLAGLDSGEPIAIDDEWSSRKRVELTARANGIGQRKPKSRRDDIE